MSLPESLQQEMNRLAGAGATAVDLHCGRERLVVEFDAVESVGCTVQSVRLESDRLAQATMARLQAISESLTARLNYLMEPLAPIEFDGERCTAQLRSNPPQHDGGRRAYYELLVERGGRISLVRYEKTPGDARRRVPASFTHEALIRLVRDMVDAL